jgi:hypothetical protein
VTCDREAQEDIPVHVAEPAERSVHMGQRLSVLSDGVWGDRPARPLDELVVPRFTPALVRSASVGGDPHGDGPQPGPGRGSTRTVSAERMRDQEDLLNGVVD